MKIQSWLPFLEKWKENQEACLQNARNIWTKAMQKPALQWWSLGWLYNLLVTTKTVCTSTKCGNWLDFIGFTFQKSGLKNNWTDMKSETNPFLTDWVFSGLNQTESVGRLGRTRSKCFLRLFLLLPWFSMKTYKTF